MTFLFGAPEGRLPMHVLAANSKKGNLLCVTSAQGLAMPRPHSSRFWPSNGKIFPWQHTLFPSDGAHVLLDMLHWSLLMERCIVTCE